MQGLSDVNTTVNVGEYERFIHGEVEFTSRERGWRGLDMIWHTLHAGVEETRRPPTEEHQLVLYCSAEERGEYRYNHGAWQRYRKRGGEWFIAPAYENHLEWRIQQPSETDLPAEICRIHLKPEVFEQAVQELSGIAHKPVRLVHRMNIRDPFMSTLARELRQELLSRSAIGIAYGSTAASMLAVHLLRNHASADMPIKPDRGLLRSSARRRVLEYLDAHLAQRITLDDLADAACMSRFHFSRVFRNTFGQSPGQYLIATRLNKARHLLRCTDETVERVAELSGFPSARAMARAMRRQCGASPCQYRRTHRGR